MDNARMKTGEKLIFAWGDVFGGGAQALISVLYLIFLTDIVGLDPAFAGAIVMVSKFWDAVCDPLVGAITDNARTRMGRRRPFILFGSIAVLIGFCLLWVPTGGWTSVAARGAYALLTLLFYNTVDTFVAIPYSSLSAEISTDIHERNGVNILRLAFSTVASAVCTLVPTMILDAYTDRAIGLSTFYVLIAVGFGIFFVIPLVLIGLFTKERAAITETKTKIEVAAFVRPLRVKAFRGLVYLYLCQSISMDILGSGIIYFSKYVLQSGSSTVFLGIFIGVQLIMFPIIHKIVDRVDKKTIYSFGLPLALVGFAGVGLYPAAWPIAGAYALTAVTAIGFAGAQLVSWIIFPDAVDVGELKDVDRATGSYSGIMTFIRKISSAIAIQVFGLMLSLTGYQNPTETNPIPDQLPEALIGIRIAMAGSFILLMGLGWFLARRYVLTNALSRRVRELLKVRNRVGPEGLSTVEKAELAELGKVLF
ncbi:MAG: MFS transporter [Candidatus Izemoplasmatales bacterium]